MYFLRLPTIAGKQKVDDEVLDNLEEVLITSDVGVDTTLKNHIPYRRPRSQRQICDDQ